MRTNIMISSRLTRRGFCYSALSIALPATKKLTLHGRLPDPKFQISDRVRTQRICDDHISQNFEGIDWECGFVVGYVWQFDEWLTKDFQQGWTYWIRRDQSNNEIFSDRSWLDFAHQSEIIRA